MIFNDHTLPSHGRLRRGNAWDTPRDAWYTQGLHPGITKLANYPEGRMILIIDDSS